MRVSKQHFRFVVKGDCDILGMPLRLGLNQTVPARQESILEPESLVLDSRSYPVSQSYRSCYILPDFSSSLCCFSHSGSRLPKKPKVQHQQLCSLSGPVDLRCAGRGREELAALPFGSMLQGTKPASPLPGQAVNLAPCSCAPLAFPVG